MSYFVYHRYGASEREPAVSSFPSLLSELEDRLEDEEHTSVSIEHESAWSLQISRGGYVVFENVEGDGDPRHMRDVSQGKVLQMMESLSKGDLSALEAEPWLPGYQ